MKDTLKDIFLMGIGAASLTRKKAENVINKTVKKGMINKKQANELVSKVMNEAKKAQAALKKEGRKEIKNLGKKLKNSSSAAKKTVMKGINKAARIAIRKMK